MISGRSKNAEIMYINWFHRNAQIRTIKYIMDLNTVDQRMHFHTHCSRAMDFAWIIWNIWATIKLQSGFGLLFSFFIHRFFFVVVVAIWLNCNAVMVWCLFAHAFWSKYWFSQANDKTDIPFNRWSFSWTYVDMLMTVGAAVVVLVAAVVVVWVWWNVLFVFNTRVQEKGDEWMTVCLSLSDQRDITSTWTQADVMSSPCCWWNALWPIFMHNNIQQIPVVHGLTGLDFLIVFLKNNCRQYDDTTAIIWWKWLIENINSIFKFLLQKIVCVKLWKCFIFFTLVLRQYHEFYSH